MVAGSLAVGKVPPGVLSKVVYPHTGKPNRRLLVGPGIGRDVGVIKYDRLFVLSSDPITGTSRRIGEHSVHVNANDIATAGARPVWYVCTILLPPGASERALSIIMRGIDAACRSLGITVVQGHTEATIGLDRPIVAGFMIGERKGRLLDAKDMRPGDAIVMTKTAGIEGTAILASDFARQIAPVETGILNRARRFSDQISVVKEALRISNLPGLRAMHDPTEGGVLNACWELGESSNLGVDVWADEIPIAEETSRICTRLRLDPLKLMSSGCLLAIVAPGAVNRVVKVLGELHVQTSIVGRMTTRKHGRFYSKNGKRFGLVAIPRDELYSLARDT